MPTIGKVNWVVGIPRHFKVCAVRVTGPFRTPFLIVIPSFWSSGGCTSHAGH
jgi:hypothetical protein